MAIEKQGKASAGREAKRIRDSENRYRRLFETAQDGILILDAVTGQITDVNPFLMRMLGYSREEFLGKRLWEIGPFKYVAASKAAFKELQRQEYIRYADLPLETNDGRSMDVEFVSNIYTVDHQRVIQCNIRDITARKQLEKIQDWLASFPELAPSPIVEVDLSGNVCYLNPAARKLFPDLQARGKRHTWMKGLEPVLRGYLEGRTSSTTRDVEVGTAFYQQVMSYVADNQRMRIYGLDITDRIQGQAALRQIRDELETRVQARTRELNEANDQLRVDIAERQRLAQNLHDAVNQSLFSAGLIAEVLPRLWERDQGAARQSLEDLRRLTRGALAEMRALLAELRPSVLTDADLGDLLRLLGNVFAGRANIPVTVTVEAEGPLPADVQVAFYRLCQEGLNNIAKHAEASRVEIDLLRKAGAIELRIRDDGRGFDPGQPPPAGHYGLSMMRERAEAAGVMLKVSSQPGHGTEIVIRWKKAARKQGGAL